MHLWANDKYCKDPISSQLMRFASVQFWEAPRGKYMVWQKQVNHGTDIWSPLAHGQPMTNVQYSGFFRVNVLLALKALIMGA